MALDGRTAAKRRSCGPKGGKRRQANGRPVLATSRYPRELLHRVLELLPQKLRDLPRLLATALRLARGRFVCGGLHKLTGSARSRATKRWSPTSLIWTVLASMQANGAYWPEKYSRRNPPGDLGSV